MNYNAQSTSEHLNNHIHDQLTKNGLDALYLAYKMEFTFGEDIHSKVAGFVKFMNQEIKDNPKSKDTFIHAIKATLLHDVGGALNNDKLMIPRVDAYGEYAEI
tara:strand:+ start:121 stop:429 length:309 start_codon:yes stop_codon:yes gene_type:complete